MSFRMSNVAMAAALGVSCASVSWGQGPVVLMGIDAEDGGPGGHGPISIYESVLTNAAGTGILDNVTNGGAGILVIGGGKSAGDFPTSFWNQIDSDLGPGLITFVNGAANISNRSFAGFAMLAVCSDTVNTPGGLNDGENEALAARSAAVADFVNGGGGLLGFSSAALSIPYGYLGSLGSFTVLHTGGYDNITPTAEGLAIGITDALDVQAWHDEYISFPSFLKVLAVNALSGNPAAIGGVEIVVPPPPPPPPPLPTARVVWRHLGSGTNVMWIAGPDGVSALRTLPVLLDSRWRIVATGDYNGDGFDDLVWRNLATGRNVIWTLDEGGFQNSTTLARVSNVAWKIVGASDIDGNGTPDLLWRHQPSGTNKVWLMDGTTVASRKMLVKVSAAYVLAATGDFDGDGRGDLLWRHQTAGRNLLWLMNGTAVATSAKLPDLNPNWRAAGAGDFDGDGHTDILWRRQNTGQNAIWRMDGPTAVSTGALSAQPWPAWSAVGITDFDGDGKDDILWRNNSNGDNMVWFADGISVAGTMWLNNIPVGDWNASVGRIE